MSRLWTLTNAALDRLFEVLIALTPEPGSKTVYTFEVEESDLISA